MPIEFTNNKRMHGKEMLVLDCTKTYAYLVAVAVVGRVAVDFGLRLPVAPAPAAVVVEAELRQRLGRHRGRHLHQLGRRHHRHQLETSEENQS